LQQEEIMWAEQHAIEEAGKIVADEYIELFNLTQLGYFSLSGEGVIVGLNLSGANMLGKKRSQLINSRFGFFVSDDTKPNFNSFLDKIFTSKVKESCEVILHTGSSLPIYAALTGIISENGLHCLVTVNDITAIRQSEDTLNKNKSRLEFAMLAANIAWWEMDPATASVTFGNRMAEMLGYTPKSLSTIQILRRCCILKISKKQWMQCANT